MLVIWEGNVAVFSCRIKGASGDYKAWEEETERRDIAVVYKGPGCVAQFFVGVLRELS